MPRFQLGALASGHDKRMSVFESMTPAERSLRGRMAVHRSWANTSDWSARSAPGRRAFDARFERQVDPEGTLPEEERLKRAAAARKAYFAELGMKSIAARRAAKSQGKGGTA